MKKIIGTLIIIILFIIYILFSNNNYNNSLEITKDLLNNKINEIYNIIHKYEYNNNAKTDITANYKGAHGSIHPSEFSYNSKYELSDNKLITLFEDQNGYNEYEYENNIIKLFTITKEEFINLFEIKEIKKELNTIKLIINADKINKIFNTNYNDINIIINLNIITKNIINYKITSDSIDLNVNKDINEIKGTINNKKLEIVDKNSLYINYNDKLKMNFHSNNKIDFTLNDYVFNIELYENKIIFKVSKESSIYKGIDAIINFEDVKIKKDKTNNKEENPLHKYFTSANLSLEGDNK